MLFNSIEFLVFFPVVCLIYFAIPHRIRYIFLLICSYYFYMCWNPEYALLMLTSTAITYCSGLLISYADTIADHNTGERRKKWFVALSFGSNLAILFFFKYFDFASATIVRLFSVVHVRIVQPKFDIILPVGISFYTFQALSYTMDVYRQEIKAEKNFLKYALFVSFFPQLVAGPIERSKNLLNQIDERHILDWERIKEGLLLMLYGFFQKVVLAEWLGIMVDSVYDNWRTCSGFQLMVATILFALQIYCDFGSYSNIAIGAANVMGFRLMENFNTPYFSKSVAEFWRRWHISLSTWFRDYLYIPMGGSRKGTLRKYFNLMVVFVVSGLWHGASWHFVIWGALNGVYQIIGDLLKPLRKEINKLFSIDEEMESHKLIRMLTTFLLVCISWVFFRTQSFVQACEVLWRIFTGGAEYWFTYGSNLKTFGIDGATLNVVLVSIGVLLATDICKYKGIVVRQWILSQGLWLRWLLILSGIFGILIFGVYGPDYDASQFIYFQF